MPEVHYAVIHTPGPRWQPGIAVREQPGLHDHVEHYRAIFMTGKLVFGGPFTDAASGGMMVFAASVSEAEARRFAADDPAVVSHLLDCDVRPWTWVFHGARSP